jgi:hypothetical protein
LIQNGGHQRRGNPGGARHVVNCCSVHFSRSLLLFPASEELYFLFLINQFIYVGLVSAFKTKAAAGLITAPDEMTNRQKGIST